VFDIYVGEKIQPEEKSIAYKLTFQDLAKTLTDEEVMEVFNKIIKEVEEKVGAKLRG
jgi:phenylalanyl-tRNA synthetase beta chain